MIAPRIPVASTPPYIKLAGVVLISDEADGKVHPDEDERCSERNARAGSVGAIARHPRCQLVSATCADRQIRRRVRPPDGVHSRVGQNSTDADMWACTPA